MRHPPPLYVVSGGPCGANNPCTNEPTSRPFNTKNLWGFYSECIR